MTETLKHQFGGGRRSARDRALAELDKREGRQWLHRAMEVENDRDRLQNAGRI